jgi:hypothetical protein
MTLTQTLTQSSNQKLEMTLTQTLTQTFDFQLYTFNSHPSIHQYIIHDN